MLMRNRLKTAIYLGNLTKPRLTRITTLEVWKVEVATYLMEMVCEAGWQDAVNEGLRKRVGEMMKILKGCKSEEVRRFAWGVGSKYFSNIEEHV